MDYEKAAFKNETMPDGLDLPDQMMFLALRMLYKQHNQGLIDKDKAKEEKGKLAYQRDKWYRKLNIAEQLSKKSGDMFKNVELAASEYAKNRTLENADKLYKAIYGMEPKK